MDAMAKYCPLLKRECLEKKCAWYITHVQVVTHKEMGHCVITDLEGLNGLGNQGR